jgi:hypothetical protein
MSIRTAARLGGAAVLAGLAGLHLAWGRGSSWPMRTRRTLSAAVAGTDRIPSPGACFAMTGVLGTAAAIAGGVGGRRPLARLARAGVAAGFLGRGLTGVTGRTGLLVPWTPSAHFVELDRRFFGPLCLGIAALVVAGSDRRTS